MYIFIMTGHVIKDFLACQRTNPHNTQLVPENNSTCSIQSDGP